MIYTFLMKRVGTRINAEWPSWKSGRAFGLPSNLSDKLPMSFWPTFRAGKYFLR
jgi:hypothetical protein